MDQAWHRLLTNIKLLCAALMHAQASCRPSVRASRARSCLCGCTSRHATCYERVAAAGNTAKQQTLTQERMLERPRLKGLHVLQPCIIIICSI